ncbi:hypothetical protein BSZ22_04100 [Bradyrhizobium canariense]|nr:hypothetical protein BSZ22_04100 [Bradyrhizobium canariense]
MPPKLPFPLRPPPPPNCPPPPPPPPKRAPPPPPPKCAPPPPPPKCAPPPPTAAARLWAKLGVANGITNATAAAVLKTFRLFMIKTPFPGSKPHERAGVPGITGVCVRRKVLMATLYPA